MATSKKNAKSTKTAHVLNLLTAPGTEAESTPAVSKEAGGETVEQSAAAAAPVSRPLTPPILEVARADDEQLSGQILQALEEEFPEAEAFPAEPEAAAPSAGELEAEETAGETEAAHEEEIVEEAPAAAAEEPEAEPQMEAEAREEPMTENLMEEAAADIAETLKMPAMAEELGDLPPEAMAAIEPEPLPEGERGYDLPVTMPENPEVLTHTADVDPNDEGLNYVNVMQILVEEKAPRYIQMFGLCPCRRCEMDVKALTLSNLVPKYVVMHKNEMVPMLTIYEGRYSSTIFAQLTRACKLVMDRPHHGR